VKKRLENELMIYGNSSLTTSIDSGTNEHKNTQLALSNAHNALKKSIATAKDSA
jgi:hypothetical protein